MDSTRLAEKKKGHLRLKGKSVCRGGQPQGTCRQRGREFGREMVSGEARGPRPMGPRLGHAEGRPSSRQRGVRGRHHREASQRGFAAEPSSFKFSWRTGWAWEAAGAQSATGSHEPPVWSDHLLSLGDQPIPRVPPTWLPATISVGLSSCKCG